MDVADVAKLANIGLSEEEITLFQRQIPQILAYVAKLREVDVETTEPTRYGHSVYNVFREDEPVAGLEVAQVLANAPAKIDGEVQVPRIVEG